MHHTAPTLRWIELINLIFGLSVTLTRFGRGVQKFFTIRRKFMNLITISGPPSSGKTSIITKTIENLKNRNIVVGVVKFDCLYTDDDKIYEKLGVPVKKGLSGALCPDHYFVSNIEACVSWGKAACPTLPCLCTRPTRTCAPGSCPKPRAGLWVP